METVQLFENLHKLWEIIYCSNLSMASTKFPEIQMIRMKSRANFAKKRLGIKRERPEHETHQIGKVDVESCRGKY